MIIVQGFMRVRPEDIELYRKRLAMHCALVQTFDGCEQYSLSEDPGEPGLLWIGERWATKEAQAAHLAADHMALFNEFMKHMSMSAAHIAVYETTDDGKWLMRIGQEKLP